MITFVIGKGKVVRVMGKIFDPQRIKDLKAHYGAKEVILHGYTIAQSSEI